MNSLRKNTIFKIALLVVLSLKVGAFVYENYASIDFSAEKISLVDLEKSENEKKEIDEHKKIIEYFAINKINVTSSNTNNNFNFLLKKYNSRYLEFTTPPPEFL